MNAVLNCPAVAAARIVLSTVKATRLGTTAERTEMGTCTAVHTTNVTRRPNLQHRIQDEESFHRNLCAVNFHARSWQCLNVSHGWKSKQDTLLAFIVLSAEQSSAQTRIHSAILVIDTSNNASYNQFHLLVRTPYLSIKASNTS